MNVFKVGPFNSCVAHSIHCAVVSTMSKGKRAAVAGGRQTKSQLFTYFYIKITENTYLNVQIIIKYSSSNIPTYLHFIYSHQQMALVFIILKSKHRGKYLTICTASFLVYINIHKSCISSKHKIAYLCVQNQRRLQTCAIPTKCDDDLLLTIFLIAIVVPTYCS